MPTLDIVVPVYNNALVLPNTLTSLYQQVVPPGWSVSLILSDDGSDDQWQASIQGLAYPPSWRPPLILSQAHAGAAAARNHALQSSRADIILLLGADIELRPGALAAHCRFHAQYPHLLDAALGFVRWDPRLAPTPLMEWMVHGGPQNNFDELLGQPSIDPTHFFYGSHLSLKREVLPARPFCEAFTNYGWEDLELGRRLHKQGLRLTLLLSAIGLHAHFYSSSDVYRRQFSAGRGLRQYAKLAPGDDIIPERPSYHRFFVRLLSISGCLAGLQQLTDLASARWTLPRLYQLTLALSFWRGHYS